MSVQTINAPSPRSLFGGMANAFRMLFIVLMACTLSACLPSGEQNVNTELFKNKDDMKTKAECLRPGMKKKDVFSSLGVNPEKFSRMSVQEMQYTIYGQSVVQGTPEQLERFRSKMSSYEGYSLPYREIKASSSLGFGTMKISKTGYDLRLVLIFEGNKLCKSTVEGTQEVKQEDDQSLWNTIFLKGLGAAF